MSALTESLIKKAFSAGDIGQKTILVDRTQIRQLCASFFKIAEGEYTELHNQIQTIYHILLVNQEAFEGIQEAWDWEGPAVDIIEKAYVGSYGESPTIFDHAKNLDLLAVNSPQSFRVSIHQIIQICQAHEEAEEKTFDNLQYAVSRYKSDVELHYDTFLKIKNVVDEYSESGLITANALKFIESKK